MQPCTIRVMKCTIHANIICVRYAQCNMHLTILCIPGGCMINPFPHQKQLIDSGLLFQDQHTFLDMPPGSGKTFLAGLAVENTIKAGYKVIYVTPLRALASQQNDHWKKQFPHK